MQRKRRCRSSVRCSTRVASSSWLRRRGHDPAGHRAGVVLRRRCRARARGSWCVVAAGSAGGSSAPRRYVVVVIVLAPDTESLNSRNPWPSCRPISGSRWARRRGAARAAGSAAPRYRFRRAWQPRRVSGCRRAAGEAASAAAPIGRGGRQVSSPGSGYHRCRRAHGRNVGAPASSRPATEGREVALFEITNLHVALEDGTEIVKGVDLALRHERKARDHGPERLGQVHVRLRAHGSSGLRDHRRRNPVSTASRSWSSGPTSGRSGGCSWRSSTRTRSRASP